MNKDNLVLWGFYALQGILSVWATNDMLFGVTAFTVVSLFALTSYKLGRDQLQGYEQTPDPHGASEATAHSLSRAPGIGRINPFKVSCYFALWGLLVACGIMFILFNDHSEDGHGTVINHILSRLVPAIILCEAPLLVIVTGDIPGVSTGLRKACCNALLPLVVAGVVISIAILQYRGSESVLIAISVCSVGCIASFNESLCRLLEVKTVEGGVHSPVAFNMSIVTPSKRPRVLILSTYAVLSWTFAAYFEDTLPAIQGWMDSTIVSSTQSYNSANLGLNSSFGNDATLTSVFDQVMDSPQRIVFRAYCTVPPGYLRGRVFERYSRGRWTATPFGNRTQQLLPDSSKSSLSSEGVRLSHFQWVPTTPGRKFTLEVKNDPTLNGSYCFLPLGIESLQAYGERLLLDRSGVPRAGIRTRYSYRATVGESKSQASQNSLDPEDFLAVSDDLVSAIRPIAEDICRGTSSAYFKANAIEAFFQGNFEYSLDRPAAPRGKDPVIYFLETRHPAHCEYFATAAVLLLRSINVPSRYVTGFVATELADNEEYWLARNRNAHAWVEAYDEAEKRWFIVEPTPGRKVVEIDFANDVQTRTDSTEDLQSSKATRSLLSTFYDLIMDLRWTSSFQHFISNSRTVILIILLLLIVYRFGIPRGTAVAGGSASQWNHLELQTLDRIAANLGHFREGSETLHRFASRLDHKAEANEEKSQQELRKLAIEYRRFAQVRYSGDIGDSY